MPQVSPRARINGGAVGEKRAVTASSTVTATLDSITGVTSVEWFIASTDETNDPSQYTLVQSGIVGETVTFTALGSGTAGLLGSRVNNGIDPSTGNVSSAMTATIKFYVPTSPGDLEVGCVNETFESDATFGSTGEINTAIRGVGAGGSVTFAAVKAALAAADTAVDFNSQKLTGIATPTASGDGANKSYVDSAAASLTSRVSTDESIRSAAVTSLTTRVSSEEVSRASADTSLTSRVSAEESARASGDASLTTRLSTAECTEASTTTSLTTRVSVEESTRASGDTSLSTRVSSEESTRASADTSLTTRLSVEESARASGDLSLTTRLSTEESTRASADTSLTTRISAEESARASGDTSLTTRVSTEESSRASGVTSLNARVSVVESDVNAATDAATASKLLRRDASGDASLHILNATNCVNIVDSGTNKLTLGPYSGGNTETPLTSADGTPLSPQLPVRYRNSAVSHVPRSESSTSTITLDGGRGNLFDIASLVHNVTFAAPTGFDTTGWPWLEVFVQQGAGAPWTISWNATFVFPTGISSAAIGNDTGEVDYYRFQFRGTYWVCTTHNQHVHP